MTDRPGARDHVYRHEPSLPVEQRMLGEICHAGVSLLDVGCAATGRSARLARELGADVVSIEINEAAIREFAVDPRRGPIALVAADMTRLPFETASFDVVLVAFHGLDYLIDRVERRRALREIERVTRPGGWFVFNAFNPIGILLTPSHLRSRAHLVHRARHLVTGRFARPTLVDVNGLELRQARPRRVVREIENETAFRLDQIANASGSWTGLVANSLFASAPYYRFRLPTV